jgi:predicted Zn-dependent protease
VRKVDLLKVKIQRAIELIDNSQYREAESVLAQTVGEYVSSPEIYNLLGILEEYKGDYTKAAKFYRVSYAFDPAYKPASANLMRVTGFKINTAKAAIDFGKEAESRNSDGSFYIEYDESKTGHIIKKRERLSE